MCIYIYMLAILLLLRSRLSIKIDLSLAVTFYYYFVRAHLTSFHSRDVHYKLCMYRYRFLKQKCERNVQTLQLSAVKRRAVRFYYYSVL